MERRDPTHDEPSDGGASVARRKLRLGIYDRKSSLARDGSRVAVIPADVAGRFVWARRGVFALLVIVWAALPWVRIEDRPAMFLDVPARRFFLFGMAFNAQDFWLVFFVLSGLLFALVVATALLGRVWCGWACPQTVFLEGLFRPIERLFEGSRGERSKRDRGAWTPTRLARKAAKHAAFLLLAALVAHIVLAYFVSLPSLLEMVRGTPRRHPTAFAWMSVVSLVLYGNFAFFREQLCLVVCPYGRLQSVLMDDDSLVVGYDERRGEPRARGRRRDGDEARGDCVDCGRCVAVCPTGIDIRNGLQVDCIACTQCIDACDAIMDELGRPRGLVRYDSLRGLRDGVRRLLRPRLALYALLGVLGAAVALGAMAGRRPFEANLLRLAGPPYVVREGWVRNQFDLHLVNKEDARRVFAIEVVDPDARVEVVMASTAVALGPLESRHVTVVSREPRDGWSTGRTLRLRVTSDVAESPSRVLAAPLLGPQL